MSEIECTGISLPLNYHLTNRKLHEEVLETINTLRQSPDLFQEGTVPFSPIYPFILLF